MLPAVMKGPWARAEPGRRPQVCSVVCMDHDESCSGWAKDGQCDDNKGFM